MSNGTPIPLPTGAGEIIAKLVKAGYSQPAAHNHADAIPNAISRMKHDLRGCGGREDGPRAAGASVTSDVVPFYECLSRRPARAKSPYPSCQLRAFNVDRLLHLAPNLLS
jgi:hypothetical protein